MSIRLRFSDADWDRIHQDYAAWWAHELDRPLVQVTGVECDPGPDRPELPSRFYSNYPELTPEELIDLVTPELEATRYYGDALPRWWVNFGPGILAGFLGARVNSVPETVWFDPMEPTRAGDLHLAWQPDNPWWLRIREITSAAVEAWEGQVAVSHTDLGGNLDVLASFLTTEGLLYVLHDAPEEIDRLVGEVTQVWLRYYDQVEAIIRPTCPGTSPWAPIWSSATCYMLQCDFSYMISPQMFERFVLPDLTACCDHLEHGFYHLDGPGAIPHLDLLLAMPRLRGVQWIPGAGNPPPEEWPHLLRRIIDAGKLCQLYVTAEGALSIVRNLGGKGFLLAVEDQMSAGEAQAFLKRLSEEDVGCAG